MGNSHAIKNEKKKVQAINDVHMYILPKIFFSKNGWSPYISQDS